jgi:hypothetical protein
MRVGENAWFRFATATKPAASGFRVHGGRHARLAFHRLARQRSNSIASLFSANRLSNERRALRGSSLTPGAVEGFDGGK